MAAQQEVDLGIKVDFLINCIHRSGIYVRLALSETLWTREECELHKDSKGGGADADSYMVIFEKEILHYTSQIWQANPGCESFQCEMFSLHQSVPIITEA